MRWLVLLLLVVMSGCSATQDVVTTTSITTTTLEDTTMTNPTIVMETSKGTIEIELNTEKAPVSVANFLSYVDDEYYDGTIFHRVIENFMVQGGGFTADGKKKDTKAPIVLESQNGLSNKRGTIAMARTNVEDSATSQFFLNVVDNDFLDYSARGAGYAVFGKVVSGLEVMDAIKGSATGTRHGMQDWPREEITITSVRRK